LTNLVYVARYAIWFFFFSSRRRHTRCYRDWSSDVCSSDLSSTPFRSNRTQWRRRCPASCSTPCGALRRRQCDRRLIRQQPSWGRSEERSVGEEGESRRGRVPAKTMKLELRKISYQ